MPDAYTQGGGPFATKQLSDGKVSPALRWSIAQPPRIKKSPAETAGP